MVKKIMFTITGMQYRLGREILEKDMLVKLVKEPDNEYDNEAIKVMIPGIGLAGYVANSIHTKLGETFSAGRLYDKFEDEADAIVRFNTEAGVIAELVQVITF